MLSKKQLRLVKLKTLTSSMIIVTSIVIFFLYLSDIFKINDTRELFSLENICYLIVYFFVGIGAEDYWFRYIQNRQLQEYDKDSLLWKWKKEQKETLYIILIITILVVFSTPFISLIFWVIYPLALFSLIPYYLFCFFLNLYIYLLVPILNC